MGVHCTIISTSVFGYFQNKILRESYKEEGHLERGEKMEDSQRSWFVYGALGQV